jgi:hypothetical protein
MREGEPKQSREMANLQAELRRLYEALNDSSHRRIGEEHPHQINEKIALVNAQIAGLKRLGSKEYQEQVRQEHLRRLLETGHHLCGNWEDLSPDDHELIKPYLDNPELAEAFLRER